MQVVQPSETGTIIPVTVQYVLDHLEALNDNSIPVYRALKRADGTIHSYDRDDAALFDGVDRPV